MADTTKITGKIYGGVNQKFWDCGEIEAFLAPKLNEFQYAYAVKEEAGIFSTNYTVYFCVVRSTGNMEWLSFCDGTKVFTTCEEAHEYAKTRAANCRYAA